MNGGAIILAAGRSKRFGEDKRQMLFKGVPLLQFTVQRYVEAGCPVLVVVDRNLPAQITTSLQQVAETIEVPEDAVATGQGLGDSLSFGVRRAQVLGWRSVLIGLADMPLVKPDTIAELYEGLKAHRAVVPVYAGQWGHPVGFQQHCFRDLISLCGDKGGRAVLNAAGPTLYEVNDEGVIFDIDTPEQLQQALLNW